MKGRGRSRELRVMDELRLEGWVVYRLAWGSADVIAMRAGIRPRLIQVKSTAGGPYERFGPAERAALIHDAIMAGASAELAYWPPRGQLRFIRSDEWPAQRAAA